MIEKKIHYIWLGKEKPEKVLKCRKLEKIFTRV